MALSEEEVNEIKALYEVGELSNRQIAEKVGCGNRVIGTIVKKYGLKKGTIGTLVKEEVATIIKQSGINAQKDTLTKTQKEHYDTLLLTEIQSQNLALNANHNLLIKINKDIQSGMKLEKVNVGMGAQELVEVGHGSSDHVNHAKAIQTVTDSLGITQRHSAVTINNQNNNSNSQVVESIEISFDE